MGQEHDSISRNEGEIVSPEVRSAAIHALTNEQGGEVSPVLRGSIDEVHVLVDQLYAAAGVTDDVEVEEDADSVQFTSEISEAGEISRELTPDQTEEILKTLRSRFEKNSHVHRNLCSPRGLEWEKVEAALRANPEALWSITQMEVAGHDPNVCHHDKEGLYFGTCCEESPKSSRNVVYDEALAAAKAMGITLMTPKEYCEMLQLKGQFDNNSQSWLFTDGDARKDGIASVGFRVERVRVFWDERKNGTVRLRDHPINVFGYFADFGGRDRGWRGSIMVKWA